MFKKGSFSKFEIFIAWKKMDRVLPQEHVMQIVRWYHKYKLYHMSLVSKK